jgi:hypothetical protein
MALLQPTMVHSSGATYPPHPGKLNAANRVQVAIIVCDAGLD